jgi:hypothetical protein
MKVMRLNSCQKVAMALALMLAAFAWAPVAKAQESSVYFTLKPVPGADNFIVKASIPFNHLSAGTDKSMRSLLMSLMAQPAIKFGEYDQRHPTVLVIVPSDDPRIDACSVQKAVNSAILANINPARETRWRGQYDPCGWRAKKPAGPPDKPADRGYGNSWWLHWPFARGAPGFLKTRAPLLFYSLIHEVFGGLRKI